jgi:hypothetical protein
MLFLKRRTWNKSFPSTQNTPNLNVDIAQNLFYDADCYDYMGPLVQNDIKYKNVIIERNWFFLFLFLLTFCYP